MARSSCLLFFLLGGSALAAGETLTLPAAIQQALAQNRQIKVEAFNRPIARANLLEQWGRFDPAINFQRNYAQDFGNAGVASYVIDPITGQLVPTGLNLAFIETDSYKAGLSGTTPWGLSYNIGGNATYQRDTVQGVLTPQGYQSFGGISITQPLLRNLGFGSNLLGVRVARADRAISEWAYRQMLIDTVTKVVLAYNDLQLAHDNLRISHRARDLAAGLLHENERRFKVGSMSQADVFQAQERAAGEDEPILSAERAVRDAENALRALMGADRFEVDGPALPIEPLPEPLPVALDPAADLRRAYDRRPDYQSARLGITRFRARESSARSLLLPQVDFVGSYGYNGLATTFAASRRMVEDHDHRGYSAGLIVNIPLTFAEGRGGYRSARLQRLQAEADLQRLEQDIALSVATAAGQIETTGQRIVASRRAFALGVQSLRAEEKKLRAGQSSTFVVAQLQEELIILESRVSQAVADHRRALANYDRETGATLERQHVQAL